MVLLHSALDLVSGSFVLGLSFLVFAGVCSLISLELPLMRRCEIVCPMQIGNRPSFCANLGPNGKVIFLQKNMVFFCWLELKSGLNLSVGVSSLTSKAPGSFWKPVRGGFPHSKKPNFSHLFMGEFELSNNLSQMRSNFTRPENAKFILFCEVTIHCCNARAVPRSAWAQSENSRMRKTMDPLVLRWPLVLDLLQVPTRKVGGEVWWVSQKECLASKQKNKSYAFKQQNWNVFLYAHIFIYL